MDKSRSRDELASYLDWISNVRPSDSQIDMTANNLSIVSGIRERGAIRSKELLVKLKWSVNYNCFGDR